MAEQQELLHLGRLQQLGLVKAHAARQLTKQDAKIASRSTHQLLTLLALCGQLHFLRRKVGNIAPCSFDLTLQPTQCL